MFDVIWRFLWCHFSVLNRSWDWFMFDDCFMFWFGDALFCFHVLSRLFWKLLAFALDGIWFHSHNEFIRKGPFLVKTEVFSLSFFSTSSVMLIWFNRFFFFLEKIEIEAFKSDLQVCHLLAWFLYFCWKAVQGWSICLFSIWNPDAIDFWQDFIPSIFFSLFFREWATWNLGQIFVLVLKWMKRDEAETDVFFISIKFVTEHPHPAEI